MTTKPKTRKAPAPDPVFAAIAEHKALIKESARLEKSYRIARDKAEKKYGEWIMAPKCGEWPGLAIVSPLYDRWNSAEYAEHKAAIRMARTKPTTLAGVGAMIACIRREVARGSDDVGDWLPTSLKTVGAALARMAA